MTRNLYERCEVVFPVVDPDLKRRLREEILGSYLHDNLKARLMDPTAPTSAPPIRSSPQRQLHLMDLSARRINASPRQDIRRRKHTSRRSREHPV